MSLTKDQLIQFMEKPGLMKEQTIGELKEIIEEFPYFQSAQLLYTCNLHTRDNFRFDSYLKICSIYATDRTVLYHLLLPKAGSEPAIRPVPEADSQNQEETSIFELSEEKEITATDFFEFKVPEAGEEELIDFDLLSFDHPVTNPGEGEFAQPSDSQQIEFSAVQREEKVDLIEQFIKINPTIQPRTTAAAIQNDRFELKEEEDNDSDEFITETLSRIYLKQGHYQKAIDSFKRLSLKFPEKSVYFAQQIEEIKKLLN